jgi:thiol peroxidase
MVKVTLKGDPFETNGDVPQKGDQAPSFTVKDLQDNEVNLSDYQGDVVLISTFPDINTSTCSRQTGKFNELAATLKDTKILSISTNTVEEQKEWCGAKQIDMDLLHDEDRSFSKTYGLYLEDIDKTARAVFVLSRKGQIVYREVVKEIAEDPDYDEAIAAARHEEAEL